MRFASVHTPVGLRAAVVTPDGSQLHVIADSDLDSLVRSGLDAALAAGERALSEPGRPIDSLRLAVPVRPGAVRDFVAFEEHVEGVRRSVDGTAGVPDQWYAAPTFYFTNPHRLVAPGEDVAVPGGSVALDLELEVAAVIGSDVSDVDEQGGTAAIFGYTLFNDWSARDVQSAEMKVGLGPCKGKDFATSLGPWIVTADELAPHLDADGFLDLACRVEIDGVVVGEDLLSHIGWTFGALVAYASRDSLVRAGDVLGSGTVGNGGCLAELWGRHGEQTPPPLRPGSVVTITVEGIGSMTNRIVAGRAPAQLPAPRRLSAEERAARRAARGLQEHG